MKKLDKKLVGVRTPDGKTAAPTLIVNHPFKTELTINVRMAQDSEHINLLQPTTDGRGWDAVAIHYSSIPEIIEALNYFRERQINTSVN